MGKRSRKKSYSRHNDKVNTERIVEEEMIDLEDTAEDLKMTVTEAEDGPDRKNTDEDGSTTIPAAHEEAGEKPADDKTAEVNTSEPAAAKQEDSGENKTAEETKEPKTAETETQKHEAEPSKNKDEKGTAGQPDNKEDKPGTKKSKKNKVKKEEKAEDNDEDLYKDEVYKDQDTSDDDMVFLDISGDEVKVIPSQDLGSSEKEHKKITISIDTEAALSWLFVLIGAAVYISLTFNNNVWLDEAFTATLVRTDMAGVLERSMADTLPPLYNIILKLTTDIFGYTVPVMKLTSAVPMILTMILGATVVRKRFGALTSYIFIPALTVMPNMMFFGVEIRMYSLGFLFATASGIFAYEVISEPRRKNWILFTLFSVLAGYTHHFAFVTVGFVYLFLLIHACAEQRKFNTERDRKLHPIILSSFAKCLFATFLLYLPCLLVTLRQFKSVSGYFSMPEVTLPVFVKYCRYPFTVGFTPLSIVLLALAVILLIRLVVRLFGEHTRDDVFALYCFILFYGVLLFGTVVSKIMTANIFVDRYLFFALGLVWLFFSIEAGTLKKPLVYCIIMLELVTGIYSYTQAFTSEYARGADEMTAWLNKNVFEGDSLYTLEDYEELAWCLPFYDGNLTNYETLDEAVTAAGGNNVWVAVMNGYEDETANELPKGNPGYAAYASELEDAGYTLEYEDVFRFDRYMFKMFRLIRQ